MLTLAGGLRSGRFIVYRDVVRREGRWAFTPRFYVLPDAPRLVRDTAGRPAFDFLWYRLPPGGSATPPEAGGILVFQVELAISPGEREEVASALKAALPAEDLAELEILSVPVTSGTVEVAIGGEASPGELASQISGSGTARLTGSERAGFVITLSRDGAALLGRALEEGVRLLRARYDLVIEHRLADVELRVWCDARRAHEAAVDMIAAGAATTTRLRERLVEQRLAGVAIVSERPIEAEHRAALEALGQHLLDAALAGALLVFDGEAAGPEARDDLRAGRLRPFAESMQWSLNHAFSESYPAGQHVVLDDLISLTAEEGRQAARRVDLPGDAGSVLEVRLECTADFARDPVDKVRVRLDYQGEAPTGPIVRSAELIFDGSSPPTQFFRTDLAAPDQRTFRYEIEVFYRGQAGPLRFAPVETDDPILVLDVDGLGVLRVGADLRDVSFDIVQCAVVEFEYPALALSHRMILDGERPAAQWEAVVRRTPEPYRYRVSWVTRDRRIEGEWTISTARRLFLDQPAELASAASIVLVAGGDFADLFQLIAEVRPAAEPQATPVEFAFSAPGESHTWRPRAPRAGGFRYQHRRTAVARNGSRRSTAWAESDSPVLLVQDDVRFEVQLVARLLDLGGALILALVDLETLDGAEPAADRATVVFRDRMEDRRWRFRLADPARHGYRHRLTLVPKQGERVVLPWQEAREQILVLCPPTP